MASSDFHNEAMDAAPCEFAHVLVPEKSYVGILKGLKAGTFWADYGKTPIFIYWYGRMV